MSFGFQFTQSTLFKNCTTRTPVLLCLKQGYDEY